MICLLSHNPIKVKVLPDNGKISISQTAKIIANLYNTEFYKHALDALDDLDAKPRLEILNKITEILMNEPIKIKKS